MTLPASIARKTRRQAPQQVAPVEKPAPVSEHALIKHVKIGDNFSGVYYVELVHIKTARNGNKYTDFTLRDKSGSAFVKYWGVVDDAIKGCFVHISAEGEEYMDKLQIVAQEVADIATPKDLSNYVPKSPTLADDADVINTYRKSSNLTCTLILERVFGDADDRAVFAKAPCSILPHYGVEGGLLAHTVKVLRIAERLGILYDLCPDDTSILLTAALLHRVGAVRAFDFVDCAPVETKHGKLLGVEYLSGESVAEAIRKARGSNGFCGETALRILHAVNACTKRYIKPMTLEAILLSEAYYTDLSMVGAMDFMENDQNTDEEFTAYDPVQKRQYYRGSIIRW